jgi:hypothetical protein
VVQVTRSVIRDVDLLHGRTALGTWEGLSLHGSALEKAGAGRTDEVQHRNPSEEKSDDGDGDDECDGRVGHGNSNLEW